MKKYLKVINVFLVLLISNVASAVTVLLPADTVVKVSLDEYVSSANSAVGQRIRASVAEDVIVNDNVVIKKGTKVRAVVSAREKRKRLGRGGNVSLQFTSTRDVNNNIVELSSALGSEGRANTGSTVALTVLFGVPGLLRRGKDAVIPKGTVTDTYVMDDMNIEIEEPEAEEIEKEEESII